MKLTYPTHPTPLQIACVASVSAQVWRERWDDSKEKEWQGRGRGEKETAFPPFPSPFPFLFVFFAPALTFAHSIGNACYIGYATNTGTLLYYGHVLYIGEWQKRGGLGTTLWPKQTILLPRLCGPKSFQDQPLLSRTSQRVIDIFIFSSQEELFAKSTFFPASIFTQKCGTDPVAHHHYPPKEVFPRKENPSWKG